MLLTKKDEGKRHHLINFFFGAHSPLFEIKSISGSSQLKVNVFFHQKLFINYKEVIGP